jgi:metallo-beta-lactamase family protein
MKLHFHGGAEMVTGSNFLVEVGDEKILIDCGFRQGSRATERTNTNPFPYDPSQIKAVLITHAHLDHTGRLGKLQHDGFRGDIYATYPTLDLAHIILKDSLNIMEHEARKGGPEPFFAEQDLINLWKSTHGKKYKEEIIISPNIKAIFHDAGHILGSSIIELYVKEGDKKTKIVFSGDLGNPPTPLLAPTENIDSADYLLIESVYGDRLHEDKPARKKKLEEIIENTIAKGGTLMIPSFAIERTQEILFELNNLVENKQLPPVRMFLDSPMAIRATAVYQKYSDFFNKKAIHIIESGDDLFEFPGLEFTLSVESSKRINEISPPKVVIAGSGMSTAGRILHHEKRNLSDPKSTLLIIGFQPHGTLGRRLLDGEKEVKIMGDIIPVRATIRAIGGYSAHADQTQLLDWVRAFKQKPKKIFTVMGEPGPATILSQKIRDNFGIETIVPKEGDVVEL